MRRKWMLAKSLCVALCLFALAGTVWGSAGSARAEGVSEAVDESADALLTNGLADSQLANVLAGTQVADEPEAAQPAYVYTNARPDPESVSVPEMSLEEFPVIDGSLACVPLLAKLTERLTGCTPEEAVDYVNMSFSNTNPCYLALQRRERDLCLAYEPAESTLEKLENPEEQTAQTTLYGSDYGEGETGQETQEPEKLPVLELSPVGRDGLVFLVNDANPVETLTEDQLQGIFTGRITNWSEVGGDDVPIQVFLRPETSGSQTLMRKLLVGDAEMARAESTVEVPDMEGMYTRFRDYENSYAGIGYSVYYYASEMMGMEGVRLLRVNDVDPSFETITSGDYTLVNDFYCVIRDDADEKTRQIRDYLLSDEGQALVRECGYASVY